MKYAICIITAGALAFGACADEAPETTDGRNFEGPGIALDVAPLDFDEVDDACYSLAVGSEAGEVWSESNLCGSQYGNAGEISYIGPCDAQGGAHPVTLIVEAMCSGAQTCGTFADHNDDGTFTWSNDDDDYQNPCPAPDGCQQTDIVCEENADTFVEFNLTFMRDAQQGFFDIAVNFNNIFCSAKVDCAYPGEGEEPDTIIELLHNPATGERDSTAVVGFACTAGAGDTDGTYLHMSDVTVSCAEGSITFSPDADGNVDFSTATIEGTNPLFGAAVYRGLEDLVIGGDDGNKVYWNLALGYDVDGMTRCDIRLGASATEGPTAPANMDSYPYVEFFVGLTNTAGEFTCSQHPMNGGNGVSTQYTSTDDEGGVEGWGDLNIHLYPEAGGVPMDEPDGVACETTADDPNGHNFCSTQLGVEAFCNESNLCETYQ